MSSTQSGASEQPAEEDDEGAACHGCGGRDNVEQVRAFMSSRYSNVPLCQTCKPDYTRQ